MAKDAKKDSATEKSAAADAAGKKYPRRVTLDLTDDQYEWLRGAAYEARTPMSAIVRAMVQLGSDKKKTAAKAIALAKEETQG